MNSGENGSVISLDSKTGKTLKGTVEGGGSFWWFQQTDHQPYSVIPALPFLKLLSSILDLYHCVLDVRIKAGFSQPFRLWMYAKLC